MIKKRMIIPLLTAGIFCSLYAFKNNPSTGRQPHPPGTDADNAGLKLPSGFGALVVADSIGKARHIVVTKEGNIYVNIAAYSNSCQQKHRIGFSWPSCS